MSRQEQNPNRQDARAIYADIIECEHHVSAKRPQMPRLSRAVQFAPYATLKGYDDLVRESARETDAQRSLDENEIEELNDKLVLLEQLDDPPEAAFTVFVPDGKKAGGRYAVLRGRITRFDALERRITLSGGEVLRIENIVQIDCDALSRDWDL
jgi:hypothetical protein